MVGRAVVTMVMSRAARKVEHRVIYLYTALQCKDGEGGGCYVTSVRCEWNRLLTQRAKTRRVV